MTVLLPNNSKPGMGKSCSYFKHTNRKSTRQNKTRQFISLCNNVSLTHDFGWFDVLQRVGKGSCPPSGTALEAIYENVKNSLEIDSSP